MAVKTTISELAQFVGERTDVPFHQLDKRYVTNALNFYLYRGKIQKIPGFSKYNAQITSAGAIQALIPFQLLGGATPTDRLVVALEKKLYALDAAGTGWTDITRTGVSDYGGTNEHTWSYTGYLQKRPARMKI